MAGRCLEERGTPQRPVSRPAILRGHFGASESPSAEGVSRDPFLSPGLKKLGASFSRAPEDPCVGTFEWSRIESGAAPPLLSILSPSPRDAGRLRKLRPPFSDPVWVRSVPGSGCVEVGGPRRVSVEDGPHS